MRCGIRRPVSRGMSLDTPHKVRRSVEIQATTPRRGLRPPSPARAGRRWPRAQPLGRQCPGKSVCGSQLRRKPLPPKARAEVMWEGRSRERQTSRGPQAYWTRPWEPKRPWDDDRRRQGERGPVRVGARSQCHPGQGGGHSGRRSPGVSNSGETEVSSPTAEQTMLRMALWRGTLSPPPQQERERERENGRHTGQGPRRTCHKPSRDPKQACGGGAVDGSDRPAQPKIRRAL